MSDYPTSASRYSTQVVGAAIFDSLSHPSKILVGQRSAPEAFRGMWEFPGGKVEPGESCQQALIREITEELGVSIALGAEIVGPLEQGWELKDTHAMRVFCAEITGGQPATLQDHSQLLWVSLDKSLLELNWIPADFPIVQALLEELGK